MAWLGKVLGGVGGLFTGGPVGSLAGGAVGHLLFDGKSRLRELDPEAYRSSVFFITCFCLLARVARADGSVTRDETTALGDFIDGDLALAAELRRYAIAIFTAAKDSGYTIEDYCARLLETTPGEAELHALLLHGALRMAWSGGHRDEAKQATCRQIAGALGVGERALRRIEAEVRQLSPEPWRILGCDPEDGLEAARTRYRQLARETHPDALAAAGLPHEMAALARERFERVQWAWETIQRQG